MAPSVSLAFVATETDLGGCHELWRTRPPVDVGSARHRRERRLRCFLRHEEMTVRMAVAAAYHSAYKPNAATYVDACTQTMTFSDAATCAATATPAPVIEAATRVFLNRDNTGFVNSQFSVFAVEASASQVVGSLHAVDESASPVYIQVHREQIAAEQESLERAQQRTVEQLKRVPFPQIQEQFVESVQVIPQKLFPERIEEQIVDIPVPPILTQIAEVVQIIPQERSQQRTVEQLVGAPVPQVVEEQQFVDEPSSEELSALGSLQSFVHEKKKGGSRSLRPGAQA